MMSLSIVIPIYNEQEVLPILHQRLNTFFSSWTGGVEFVLVNDGSSDGTFEYLSQWAANDPRVNVIHMPINIGHQKAILSGMAQAKNEVILSMDADLQDPLEIIPKLWSHIKMGNEIVHTRRLSREGENALRSLLIWIYYRAVKKTFLPDILIDVGDFRMVTRAALNQFFIQFPSSIFLRADFPKLKLKQTVVTYDRNKRQAGKSKFPIRKLIKLGFSSLFRQKK